MTKSKKLATKISSVMAIALVGIFILLTIVMIATTSGIVGKANTGEFIGIANANAQIVQGIADSADGTAKNIYNYIERTFANGASGNISNVEKPSVIYDKEIKEYKVVMENYFMNNMWSLVNTNDEVLGVGILFDPGQFDSSIRSYAIYANKEDAKNQNVQTLGNYKEYREVDYYVKAKETEKLHITDPYEKDGVKVITFSYPMIFNNLFYGIVTVDLDVSNFSKVNTQNDRYDTMCASVLSQNGVFIYDSKNPENIGKPATDVYTQKQYDKIVKNIEKNTSFNIDTTINNVEMKEFFYPIVINENTWWAKTAVSSDNLTRAVKMLALLMSIMLIITLGLIIAIVSILIRRGLKPINKVIDAASEIVQGNLDVQLDVSSNDEIGELNKSFMTMTDNLKTIILDLSYLTKEMADGNFAIRTSCEDKYIGKYSEIITSIRRINTSFNQTLKDINIAAEQVNSGAEQVSGGAQALSQGATQQAASIEELSATINDIYQQINENTQNTKVATKMSQEATEEINDGKAQMEKMLLSISQISEKSNQIGKIIKTIDDIAFQTNILALNAAVEAARAGAAGKGFAVVADEVRNLAQKSAEAARGTTDLIEDTVKSVNDGIRIANKTAQSFNEIVNNSLGINESIIKIEKASISQSTSIAQVTQGVEQISAVVQTNSATSEQSAAASEELSSQAQILKDLVGRFKLNDGSNYIETEEVDNTEEVCQQLISDENDINDVEEFSCDDSISLNEDIIDTNIENIENSDNEQQNTNECEEQNQVRIEFVEEDIIKQTEDDENSKY
ncbi:MAG: methyl-accepting chemotaxis protein [Oscillospiraceae bacterium]